MKIATLHNNIEQLYEEILSIHPKPITDFIEPVVKQDGQFMVAYPSGWRLKKLYPEDLNEGGIYIFWWLNNREEDMGPLFNGSRTSGYEKKGKKEKDKQVRVKIEVTDEWLRRYDRHIPLYIGKTSCLINRFKQHLQIHQPKWCDKTSSNQLRFGLQQLFKDTVNVEMLVRHIGVSYISLPEYENAVNRFYIENYLIGKLLPILNVDVER